MPWLSAARRSQLSHTKLPSWPAWLCCSSSLSLCSSCGAITLSSLTETRQKPRTTRSSRELGRKLRRSTNSSSNAKNIEIGTSHLYIARCLSSYPTALTNQLSSAKSNRMLRRWIRWSKVCFASAAVRAVEEAPAGRLLPVIMLTEALKTRWESSFKMMITRLSISQCSRNKRCKLDLTIAAFRNWRVGERGMRSVMGKAVNSTPHEDPMSTLLLKVSTIALTRWKYSQKNKVRINS